MSLKDMFGKASKEENEKKIEQEQLNEFEEEHDVLNNTTKAPDQELLDNSGQTTEIESRIVEAQQQAERYKDMFLRKSAEMENFRRRKEEEVTTIIRFSNERIVTELLPIVDDFERSLKAGKKNHEQEAFYKGVELIYQKMVKKLADVGVKPFETVGKKFDVHYHDALMQIPQEGIDPDTIVEEVEKGYMYHDRVIRHAKVVVAGIPANETNT
jgi:molecular chaperone GrpE